MIILQKTIRASLNVFRFQNRTFDSVNVALILETELQIWVMRTTWKGKLEYQVEQEVWNKALIPEKELRFQKRS